MVVFFQLCLIFWCCASLHIRVASENPSVTEASHRDPSGVVTDPVVPVSEVKNDQNTATIPAVVPVGNEIKDAVVVSATNNQTDDNKDEKTKLVRQKAMLIGVLMSLLALGGIAFFLVVV
jgi:hypothetical protein